MIVFIASLILLVVRVVDALSSQFIILYESFPAETLVDGLPRARSLREHGAEEWSNQRIGCAMALAATHVEDVRLQICQYWFQRGWRHAPNELLKDMIRMRRQLERFEAYVAPQCGQDCHRCVFVASATLTCNLRRSTESRATSETHK